MSGITINPAQQTNALGLFSTTTEGYIAGVMSDDPVARYYIASGVVDPGAAAPMYAGEGITDSLTQAGTEASVLGNRLNLATAQANLTGFTVANQSTAMIQTPQSPVPQAPQGGAINFVRFKSGARLALPISPANAATLLGSASNVALYWDFVNQVVLLAGATPMPVTLLDVNIGNSKVVTSSGGNLLWNNGGSCVLVQI